jgi:hypothetical protein
MPLFDISKLRGVEIPIARINRANEGVDKLRARLVDEIHTHVLPDWFVQSQTKIFFQSHIRRALMLIEGGYEAYLSERGLISFMCVRGIYESTACVFDFCDKLYGLLDEGNFERTAAFILTSLLSARSKELLPDNDNEFDFTATNILSQIDRFSKHVDNARQEYDHFSEFLHPNSLGTSLYFSDEERIDEDRSVVRFTNDSGVHNAAKWLVKAGFLSLLMDAGIGVTEKRLNEHTFLASSPDEQ